jgi:hypothetical protein
MRNVVKVVKSAQELLKEKIEKVRQEDEKERQLDPEKEYQWALLMGVTKIASYMSPNAGGGGVAGSQRISTAVPYTGVKRNFGDLTP